MRALFMLVAGAWLAGCWMNHGAHAETFEVAQGPRGIMAEVKLGKSSTTGELLASSDSTLVLDTGPEIAIVRIEHVDRLSLRTADRRRGRRVRWVLTREELTYDSMRKRVQSVSRFPFGMTEVAERELLRERGQASPRRIVP
jgi:hypothetical protein